MERSARVLRVTETTRMPCDISAVIPVFNEHRSLAELDHELRATLHSIDRSAEIIYVDDCSRDGSRDVLARIVRENAADRVRTRVVFLRRNYGQTAAMAAGFDLADGKVVVPLDADRQNNPADIPKLLEVYESGFDCVSGWRKNRQDKAISRRWPSVAANWLIGRVSGVRLHDYGCTLKAYNAAMLKELHLYGEMHRFIPLYLARLGGTVTEIPVDHRPRVTGQSKYGGKRVFKVALDLLLVRFMTRYHARPMHFFGQAGLVFLMLMSMVLALMVVFKYGWLRLIGVDYQVSFVQTPLPTVAAVFFVGAVNSVFFGIVAEVLVRVYHESQGIKAFRVGAILDSAANAEPVREERQHVWHSGHHGATQSRPR